MTKVKSTLNYLSYILLALLLGLIIMNYKRIIEGFHGEDVPQDIRIEERINETYRTVLERQPSPKEYVEAVRMIEDGGSIAMLHRRLIDSDEYQRMVKTQTDTLFPEINKMLYDKILLSALAKLYENARGEKIDPKITLPLKDIYLLLDYNPTAFQCLLLHAKYPRFEMDIEFESRLKPSDLLMIFNKYFDVHSLQKEAEELIMKQKAWAKGGFVYNKETNEYTPFYADINSGQLKPAMKAVDGPAAPAQTSAPAAAPVAQACPIPTVVVTRNPVSFVNYMDSDFNPLSNYPGSKK